MKIGISCYPTHGGSGVVATELGKHLAERGHEAAFISFSSPLRLQQIPARITIHEIHDAGFPFKQYPYTIALAAKMTEVARKRGLQVLHAHYAIPFAVAAIIARQMAPELGLKVVTTLHGTDITLVGSHSTMKAVTTWAIESSDAVTAVSHHLKDETYRIFGVKKEIRVIYNFIDMEHHHCSVSPSVPPPREPGLPTLMHISNFRAVKRIGDVIRIFAGVRERMEARLVMVGDGPESMKAEQLVRDLGLSDDVEFIGVVDDIAPVITAAELLLLPSETESFGMVALEAMASCVPVVATSIGGIPEVVEHGVTGFLAPVGEVGRMADYCVQILSDEPLRQRLGKAGRARALERFDYRDIISRYESLYEEIIAG